MLLTLDEFRGLSESTLDDEPLQLLLDAAEAEITGFAGPVGEITEIINTGGRLLVLGRPAASITSITETSRITPSQVTILAADDYLAYPGGLVYERLRGGTNSRSAWYGRVTVTYVPEDDLDIRKGVQADLVNLMLNYAPGYTSETVGAWTRQLGSNREWNQSTERGSILSRLGSGGRMVVV